MPVLYQSDDRRGSTGLVDDVRVAHWFPYGCTYTRIHVVPGSDLTLANDYTIITSAQQDRAPANESVGAHLHCETTGSLLVVRHHQRYLMSVTNVHSAERKLIDFVVRQ